MLQQHAVEKRSWDEHEVSLCATLYGRDGADSCAQWYRTRRLVFYGTCCFAPFANRWHYVLNTIHVGGRWTSESLPLSRFVATVLGPRGLETMKQPETAVIVFLLYLSISMRRKRGMIEHHPCPLIHLQRTSTFVNNDVLQEPLADHALRSHSYRHPHSCRRRRLRTLCHLALLRLPRDDGATVMEKHGGYTRNTRASWRKALGNVRRSSFFHFSSPILTFSDDAVCRSSGASSAPFKSSTWPGCPSTLVLLSSIWWR